MSNNQYPTSPRTEIDGLPYFPRLAEKIRLHEDGNLHPDLHDNLGQGMDLWMCQFLGVSYDDLKQRIINGASDAEALAWAKKTGTSRSDQERAWFISYLSHRGFRDDLSDKLQMRIKESGFQDRDDILTFFDYIDADEGRL